MLVRINKDAFIGTQVQTIKGNLKKNGKLSQVQSHFQKLPYLVNGFMGFHDAFDAGFNNNIKSVEIGWQTTFGFFFVQIIVIRQKGHFDAGISEGVNGFDDAFIKINGGGAFTEPISDHGEGFRGGFVLTIEESNEFIGFKIFGTSIARK